MRPLARLFQGSPLRHPAFRLFYFGSIGAALGYTMQGTVSAWLMATLTPSPLMVALVQTASMLPTLLFGVPAGALADIVDRRHIMLVTCLIVLATTALIGGVTLAGAMGPVTLLLLTFVIGAGFTFYLPAQQASINDLVNRDELPRAVAQGAVAFNVARAIGPALAGAFAAWTNSGFALLFAAVFFVMTIVAARKLHAPPRHIRGVPETLFEGMLSGLRYARHSPPLVAFILRNVSFALCASALWALLPVVARDELELGAGGYGLLSGSFGIGAIMGALYLPRVMHQHSLNRVVVSASVLAAAAILLVALSTTAWLAVGATFCGGAAWVSVFASLSAGTQSTAPAWVRARALAMNLVAVQASLAIGSALWGWLATQIGTPNALTAAAATMLVLLGVNRRVRVQLGSEADVTPGTQLPELAIQSEPSSNDGPVLIQVEYRVDAERRADFLRAIGEVENVRRRNGASDWRVFRDLGEDGVFVERFIIGSWAEYVRLRTRATQADRTAVEAVRAIQRPDTPIRVSRLIGVGTSDEAKFELDDL